MPVWFSWTEEELAYLKKRDKRLAAVIELAGPVQREIIPDLFTALVHSIAGQQISGLVHLRIWERMQAALPEMTPQTVLALGAERLRSLGLSSRKVEYILGAAEAFASGELSSEELAALDDKAFCARLVTLRGIGQWTAEMLLIFCLQRKNVLSFGDFGIRRGLRMLCHRREVSRELFERCKKRFSPYCSLASLYLWELASGSCEGYTDPGMPASAKRAGRPKAGANASHKTSTGQSASTGTVSKTRAQPGVKAATQSGAQPGTQTGSGSKTGPETTTGPGTGTKQP